MKSIKYILEKTVKILEPLKNEFEIKIGFDKGFSSRDFKIKPMIIINPQGRRGRSGLNADILISVSVAINKDDDLSKSYELISEVEKKIIELMLNNADLQLVKYIETVFDDDRDYKYIKLLNLIFEVN